MVTINWSKKKRKRIKINPPAGVTSVRVSWKKEKKADQKNQRIMYLRGGHKGKGRREG